MNYLLINSHFMRKRLFGGRLLCQKGRSLLFVIFVSTLLLAGCFENESDCRENGAIFPQFCTYYDVNQVVLGPPISDYFFETDEETGESIAIQYFEGMRLEYHGNRPEGERVQPAQIGVELFSGAPQYQSTIEGPFKEIYDKTGSSVLGRPISNERIEFGRKVQYFENARLRFEPTVPQVMNDTLGQAHMQRHYPGMAYRPAFLIAGNVPIAEISGYLSAPILYSGDPQTLIVEVKSGQAALNAAQISVRYETVAIDDGRLIEPRSLNQEPFVIGQTDQNGYFEQRLEMPDSRPGDQIRIEIIVDHPTIDKSSIFLSYKTWW